jgi:hypothetical protein
MEFAMFLFTLVCLALLLWRDTHNQQRTDDLEAVMLKQAALLVEHQAILRDQDKLLRSVQALLDDLDIESFFNPPIATVTTQPRDTRKKGV